MGQASSASAASSPPSTRRSGPRHPSRGLLTRRSSSRSSSSLCETAVAGPSSVRPLHDTADSGTKSRLTSSLKRIRQSRSSSCPSITGLTPPTTPIATEAPDIESVAPAAGVQDKPDEGGRLRPPLRQSLSVSRLSATDETLEPPLEILPLQEEPEEIDLSAENAATSASVSQEAGSRTVEGGQGSSEQAAAPSSPARRIVVTGTVSTLPRSSPALAALRSATRSAASLLSSNPASSSSASYVGSSDNEMASGATTPATPSEAAMASRETSSPTPFASTSSVPHDGHAEQATLISRLLSVAAAATAASLLPGHIQINGHQIEGFPRASGTMMASASPSGIPTVSPVTPGFSPARNNTSWRERLRGRSRSYQDTSRSSSQPPSEEASSTSPPISPLSPLQAILRQALAAEFGAYAPEVRRADETDATSRPTSPLLESSSAPTTSPATNSLSDGLTAASAATFLLSSPSPDRAAGSMSSAPEGSFERFLFDLQTDVSSAILRALRDQSEEGELEPFDDEFLLLSRSATAVTSRESRARRISQQPVSALTQPPFSFFRSYRWPLHELSPAGTLSEARGGSSAVEGLAIHTSPSDADRGEQSNPSVEPSSGSETSDGTGSETAMPVCPVLMVGVRTIDISLPSAMPSPPTVDEATSSTSLEGESVSSTYDTTDPSPVSTLTGPARQSESQRSWVIWIAGGIYPPSHPLLSFPALLSGFDNAASYEELLRLAELMGGQHKPPVASQADIDASGLQVVRGAGLAALTAAGEVLSNTSERCLICLEDWQEDDLARILGCKHAFHRACVDKWLAGTNNSCPCCRSTAVKDITSAPTTTTA